FGAMRASSPGLGWCWGGKGGFGSVSGPAFAGPRSPLVLRPFAPTPPCASRDFGALLPGLGEADRDRLLAALHTTAAATGTTAQRAALAAAHRAGHGAAGG